MRFHRNSARAVAQRHHRASFHPALKSYERTKGEAMRFARDLITKSRKRES